MCITTVRYSAYGGIKMINNVPYSLGTFGDWNGQNFFRLYKIVKSKEQVEMSLLICFIAWKPKWEPLNVLTLWLSIFNFIHLKIPIASDFNLIILATFEMWSPYLTKNTNVNNIN